IKVFIVDDHEIIRRGLKMILKEEADIIVVDEAQNGLEAIAKMKILQFDIMLLDLNMPGINGLELIHKLKSLNPKIRILVLSIHPEDQFALRALKAGACGYLSKDVDMGELVVAIRKIHTRGKYLSTVLAEHLAFDIAQESDVNLHEKLSNREHEIMRMLATGKKVKEIAAELSLSISSVFTFRTRIFEKLNVKSNVELTHYAMKNKLVD
ncbi:MAG: response regulator transcription factor, partial [Candidatus Falkowbacteria bacterium]|nr:response regulator transcription factor [Candidatus Falkowbacteria bacterium]